MQDINPYLAHSPTDAHPEGQSLQDHLENVAQLSASFSRPFGELIYCSHYKIHRASS